MSSVREFRGDDPGSVCFAFVMALAALLATPARAGLIAHWDCNEGAGNVLHDQVGGFHGQLHGCVLWANDGVCVGLGPASCLYIDQDATNPAEGGYVDMGDPEAFRFPAGEFSFIAWIRTCRSSRPQFVLSRHLTETVNGYFLGVSGPQAGYGVPDKTYFYVSDYPGEEAISSTSVNDGNWHQIAGTYAPPPGNTRIFVDGSLENERPSPRGMVVEPASFLLGGLTSRQLGGMPGGGGYSGLIDDVRLFDHALTEAEVGANFGECRPTETPELLCTPCLATPTTRRTWGTLKVLYR